MSSSVLAGGLDKSFFPAAGAIFRQVFLAYGKAER